MSNYSNEAPFEASMMVYFRERIKMGFVKKINQKMVIDSLEKTENTEIETATEIEDNKKKQKRN